ncbi:MAG: histidine kinase dimerization/phospho-acceptor domain-containing protein, partial [Acidobacteriota bacterium]
MRIGIRARMLAAGGSLMTVLLVALWLSLLLVGRTFILDDLRQDTVELANTFSTFTLDALIEKESGSGALMEMLDDAIFLSLEGAKGVRRITVYDPGGIVIAGVPTPFPLQGGPRASVIPDIGAPVTAIHKDPDLGWVAEAIVPLRTGSRIWGFLRFSSDARDARHKIQRLFFVLMGAILLASLSLLWITSALVSRLTSSLVDMADQMAQLDPDTPEELRISAADHEVHVVEKSFNLLVRRLKASRRKLIETERRMARADKLNSLALLSAGVAHEVNNPLNGVRNCLVAIQKEPDDEELLREYLGLALEGLEQIESVIAK